MDNNQNQQNPLKDILGDAYSEELEAKLNKHIGKNYVARADFNKTKENLSKTVNVKDSAIKSFREKLANRAQAQTNWEQKYRELEKNSAAELSKQKDVFNGYRLESELKGAKAKNTKAVQALLDMSKITFGDNEIGGLNEEISRLQKSDSYLFNLESADVQTGTGFSAGADPKTQKPTAPKPKII